MANRDDVAIAYEALDHQQRLFFLDQVEDLLNNHEGFKADALNRSVSRRERFEHLVESLELRQLIHAVKNQRNAVRTNRDAGASELWQAIHQFFEEPQPN